MGDIRLACDQAIFTSIRGPMAEGYRIVAASRGLNTAEKQEITRHSPSHEALCQPAGDAEPVAASFYALPTERLCVAHSCAAGAEHTGRGGNRVYTRCVVFDAVEFPRCGYNPFNVLRAMAQAGLTAPELKPPPVLPTVELPVSPDGAMSKMPPGEFTPDHRRHVLDTLLAQQDLIVDAPSQWLPFTEAILLGLPGPMRCSVSFAAGLKFSSGRRHQLQLLHDEKGVLQGRLAGQPVQFVDTSANPPTAAQGSMWARFVEGHWSRGDLLGLARRTSKPFAETGETARERIAMLYITTDSLPARSPVEILTTVRSILVTSATGPEAEIGDELIEKAQRVLLSKIAQMNWSEADPILRPVVALWRQSPAGARFAQPLLEWIVRRGAIEQPLAAAETALLIESDVPAHVDRARHQALIDEVLRRFAEWLRQDAGPLRSQAENVATRWQRHRPQCALVQSLVPAASTR